MSPLKDKIARAVLAWIQQRKMDIWGFEERLQTLGARHAAPSGLLSTDDSPGQPSDRLLNVTLEAVSAARKVQFPDALFDGRPAMPHYFNQWPGEHYRLLAAFCEVLPVRNVVEIGTFTGLSSLAIRQALSADGKLTTFDIIPWSDIPGTFLTVADFNEGRLAQEVADLSDIGTARRHADVLQSADLIFIDAAKDGIQERLFLENFAEIGLKPGALLMFDDIRLLSMLSIWRAVDRPKLDLTSFGHFTGTGLVDWS